jgi:hypothetical protein
LRREGLPAAHAGVHARPKQIPAGQAQALFVFDSIAVGEGA